MQLYLHPARAQNRLRRAVRSGLKRIVPPLQGSGIGLGSVDPGLQPGLRYFAPLGLKDDARRYTYIGNMVPVPVSPLRSAS